MEEKHFPARGVCLSWIVWSWQKCAKDGNLAETKREAEDWGQEVRGSKEGWMAERGPAATDFPPPPGGRGEKPLGGWLEGRGIIPLSSYIVLSSAGRGRVEKLDDVGKGRPDGGGPPP